MKKIAFLILCSIYSLTCLGQQIALNDTVSIRLPDGAEKLNKDQISSFVNKKYSNNNIALRAKTTAYPEYVYKINEVLIMFNPKNDGTKVDNDFLLNRQRGFDEMMKKNKSHNSFLKNINGNQILVEYYTITNVGHYSVSCRDSTYSRSLGISLQFDESDKGKATKIVDDLINNISFTK